MKVDRADIYSIVWDMTIGLGVMPERWTEDQVRRVEDRVGRELTLRESDEARSAWERCYQEFHSA